MTTDNNLTPEQRKAIKVVQDCLPMWHQYLCDDVTGQEICYTDYKAFTTRKISYSDLHHGANWTWNQSNAKKKVIFENDISVVVQKFNTRKKKKTAETDGTIFKLWMFHVYKHSENSFLGVFIWCEKGYAPLNTYYNSPNNNPCYYYNSQPMTSYFPATSEDLFPAPTPTCSTPSAQVPSLTLEDLDFLRPFVDDFTAASFGW